MESSKVSFSQAIACSVEYLFANRKRCLFLIIAVFINSVGIALGIKAGVGATMWTAAFNNFSNLFGITSGQATAIISFLIFLLSKIIGRDFKIRKSLGTLSMCVLLSVLIDLDLKVIGFAHYNSIFTNYIAAIVGVFLIAAAIAIEIKVDICFLALDDFLNNLKTYVFKGNILKASITSLIVATGIAVVCGLFYGQIVNFEYPITFITIFAFGSMIDICMKVIKINFIEINEIEPLTSDL